MIRKINSFFIRGTNLISSSRYKDEINRICKRNSNVNYIENKKDIYLKFKYSHRYELDLENHINNFDFKEINHIVQNRKLSKEILNYFINTTNTTIEKIKKTENIFQFLDNLNDSQFKKHLHKRLWNDVFRIYNKRTNTNLNLDELIELENNKNNFELQKNEYLKNLENVNLLLKKLN